MAGFKDQAIYPLRVTPGSIAQAKKLASGNTRDGKAVIWTSNRGAAPLQAQVVQFNLKNIGIDSEIKLLPRAQQFGNGKIRAQATYDITLEAWGADYNDPFDFLNILLDGSQIDSTGNNNYAYYNSAKFNKQMQQAALLSGAKRGAAYQVLDKQMMTEDPPWAPTQLPERPDRSCRTGSAASSSTRPPTRVRTWLRCASSNTVGRRTGAACPARRPLHFRPFSARLPTWFATSSDDSSGPRSCSWRSRSSPTSSSS